MTEEQAADSLRNILEAALFAAEEPQTLEQLGRLFPEEQRPGRQTLAEAVEALAAEYGGRGVRLVESGGGYQFQTHPATNPWVHRLHQHRTPRLSRAVLETLAIIAYRQPATRAEVEDIRGVSLSSGVLKTLTERGWVQVVGRKEVPGRPSLYGTTDTFLAYFGLNRLEDLPPLKEIQDLDMEALVEQLGEAEDESDASAESETSGEAGGEDDPDGHG